MNSNPKSYSSPFTATQWQELENQALIFKYMVSGISIPPHLILSLKKNLISSISSTFFPHQPIGWGCLDMGLGRKTDPEPGRCRRTDGKKWRCSKEAYPDSKYCEKHMHRGRNRSRKPVEIISSTNNKTNSSLISDINQSYNHVNYLNSSINNPFLFHQSSSSRTPSAAFSPNTSNPQMFLCSGTHSQTHKDYRDINGRREEVGVQAFFPSVADSTRSSSIGEIYNHQPIGMDSYQDCYQSVPQSHHFYTSKQARQEQEQEQHCFVLGTDFNKSLKSAKTQEHQQQQQQEAETQKPLLHFFEDCPPKNSDSWLDLASNSSIQTGNFIGL